MSSIYLKILKLLSIVVLNCIANPTLANADYNHYPNYFIENYSSKLHGGVNDT